MDDAEIDRIITAVEAQGSSSLSADASGREVPQVNLTSDLASSLGSSGAATDTLEVGTALEIPALAPWGFLLLAGLLALLGVRQLRLR